MIYGNYEYLSQVIVQPGHIHMFDTALYVLTW